LSDVPRTREFEEFAKYEDVTDAKNRAELEKQFMQNSRDRLLAQCNKFGKAGLVLRNILIKTGQGKSAKAQKEISVIARTKGGKKQLREYLKLLHEIDFRVREEYNALRIFGGMEYMKEGKYPNTAALFRHELANAANEVTTFLLATQLRIEAAINQGR